MAPVKIDLTGSASVSLQPERGIVYFSVSSNGANQAAVSREVQDAVKNIHTEIKQLTTTDFAAGPEAKPAILRWSSSAMLTSYHYETYYVDRAGNVVDAAKHVHFSSKTKTTTGLFGNTINLQASRYVPDANTSNVGGGNNSTSGDALDEDVTERKRKHYVATVDLVARLQDFEALSVFTTSLASVPLVVVSRVEWVLTEQTQKKLRARVNGEAYTNGYEDAKAFAEAMGRGLVTPISIERVSIGSSGSHGRWSGGESGHPGMYMTAFASVQPREQSVSSSQNTMTYVPQDINFSTSCELKFQIE